MLTRLGNANSASPVGHVTLALQVASADNRLSAQTDATSKCSSSELPKGIMGNVGSYELQ